MSIHDTKSIKKKKLKTASFIELDYVDYTSPETVSEIS